MPVNKIWNTGVDDNGTLLHRRSVDPHWKLIQGPNVGTTPQPVYVVDDQSSGGNYFTQTDSLWVWAEANAGAALNTLYVFQTEFLLDISFKTHWLQIAGQWGADNFGYLTIDSMPPPADAVTGEVTLPPGMVLSNFNQAHYFSISQAHRLSQSHWRLTEGRHTLEVSVFNEGKSANMNPAGFNLSVSLIKNPILLPVQGVPVP